jgi:ABC-type Na+ efflux pump permease subunit
MSAHTNDKKYLWGGLAMTVVFLVVLVFFFIPMFGKNQNGLDYLDNLYNSISKDSAYYIPDLKDKAAKFDGAKLEATLDFTSKETAARAALLFAAAGAAVKPDGEKLAVSGDLGKVLAATLTDTDDMFHNQGDKLSSRYEGKDAKLMLYTWWNSYKALEKSLNRQEAFDQAKFVKVVQAKAVEMSYNYFGIEPQSIGERWLLVVFSLLFYVFYTLWYGYGVMYIFEGTGYQLEH